MSERFGIREIVLEQIGGLARKHSLETVVLFGSRARGDFHRASDIDLAVRGGDVTGFALDIEEDTDTLLRFDVVDLGQAVQEELLRSIQREGVVLYEKV